MKFDFKVSISTWKYYMLAPTLYLLGWDSVVTASICVGFVKTYENQETYMYSVSGEEP